MARGMLEAERQQARLTLAIPFHRGLAHLREAIESVLAQSEPRWRLLVVDDLGELGKARELVATYADGRIEYRANEAGAGMVRNWNRCLEGAPTDLVTLLHADDRLLRGYVALMLRLADAHPGAVAFFCRARIIDAEGRPTFSFPDAVKSWLVPRGDPVRLRGERGLRALARGDFVMCPSLCYRKSVLGNRRFEERWRQVQDLDLLARLLLEDEELVGSRAVAYAYRRHPESATARQSESLLRFEEELAVHERIAARASARGWDSAARVARRKLMVKLHLAFRIAGDLVSLRLASAGRKLRFLFGGRGASDE